MCRRLLGVQAEAEARVAERDAEHLRQLQAVGAAAHDPNPNPNPNPNPSPNPNPNQDLLSQLDELMSCTTTMRLAQKPEEVLLLPEAERHVLVHLDELVLIRLPALLRDLAHALAHARKRPAPAHGHHQEDPLA